MTSSRHSFALNCAQLREIERQNASLGLMQRAGLAAAHFLRRQVARGQRILLLAGPGNNGGDAFACAGELCDEYSLQVIFTADPAQLPADAQAARAHALGAGVVVSTSLPPFKSGDWVVDGLFGIGLRRPIEGHYAEWIATINAARTAKTVTVLALDIPSGCDADSGALIGPQVISADHTLSFIALKPGLLTGPALDHVGQVHNDALGLDLSAWQPQAYPLLDADFVQRTALTKHANRHKGSAGTLALIGGNDGMLGALTLASRAALRAGAGKVRAVWLAKQSPAVDSAAPEIMMAAAEAYLADSQNLTMNDALVIGCGGGVKAVTVRALKKALASPRPLLLDADALNLIALCTALRRRLQSRAPYTTLLTPHPAEAARLLTISTAEVQQDRIAAAKQLAKELRCSVALKGAGTIIAGPDGISINGTGNPLLATAGTGDVLAGIAGALLAQGYPPTLALQRAVGLHGWAADRLLAQGYRHAVASDIIDAMKFLP